ncbi:hypothetical protein BST61_g4338 [Cercospora zeina]
MFAGTSTEHAQQTKPECGAHIWSSWRRCSFSALSARICLVASLRLEINSDEEERCPRKVRIGKGWDNLLHECVDVGAQVCRVQLQTSYHRLLPGRSTPASPQLPNVKQARNGSTFKQNLSAPF